MANVVVSVEALGSAMHLACMVALPPMLLAALIAMLATLRNAAGDTTIDGPDADQSWSGVEYPEGVPRRRTGSRRCRTHRLGVGGRDVMGPPGGHRPRHRLPGRRRIVGVGGARARARINLRVPPGVDAVRAQDLLVDHLTAAAPWVCAYRWSARPSGHRSPRPRPGPPRHFVDALSASYGCRVARQGRVVRSRCAASSPRLSRRRDHVAAWRNWRAWIHAPNESVDPSEIEHLALAEAIFPHRVPRLIAGEP